MYIPPRSSLNDGSFAAIGPGDRTGRLPRCVRSPGRPRKPARLPRVEYQHEGMGKPLVEVILRETHCSASANMSDGHHETLPIVPNACLRGTPSRPHLSDAPWPRPRDRTPETPPMRQPVTVGDSQPCRAL